MAGDIPTENPDPSKAENALSEDLSRAAMTQVPGMVSAVPLTPKDWAAPGTVDAAKTTSEFVVSILPIPGLQEMGVFGKVVEGGITLYRRVTGAIHLADNLGTKTSDVAPQRIEPLPLRGAQSDETIRGLTDNMRRAVGTGSDLESSGSLVVKPIDADTGISQEILPREIDPYEDALGGKEFSKSLKKLDEIRKYALEMGQLEHKPDIMDYVENQAAARGPLGIENMEETIASGGIREETTKFWQEEIAEFKVPIKRIAQLQDTNKIMEFARFYASKRPVKARTFITAARENGWIHQGTENAWAEALARIPK